MKRKRMIEGPYGGFFEEEGKRTRAYSVQVLSRYDAFSNRLLDRWFTVEWRRLYGTSEGAALRTSHFGPHEAVGKITRLGR